MECIFVNKLIVPSDLTSGTKFFKWPKSDGDDSFVPVTLKVDANGHVIYWKEPNKDTETLEISSIRDARCGKYAKEPKQDKLEKAALVEPELGKILNGSIPLVDRCLSIVFGHNFVDVCFLNFIALQDDPQDILQVWSDYLLKAAYHPRTRHISAATSIEKAYTKLTLETNHAGEIPVKKLMKLLGGRSRIEHALSAAGFPTNPKKFIDPEELPLVRFKKLIQLCCPRPELDQIFSDLSTGSRKMYVNQEKFQEFINKSQRDPKLNEVLYPLTTEEQALDLIQNYEMNVLFSNKGQLTQDGFDAFLQSDDNLIVDIKAYTVHQDMGYALPHYFINSSHNTYLSGNQYSSRSSAEMYRQVLLSGCRCVELDCWEGDDEPLINHGFTFCTPVLFKEVIEAINECAFKTSPFPVILSFENHVESKAKQAKMAQYCRDIFKEKLLVEPLENYPLENGANLPPPKDLLYKIIIKNKKQKHIKQPKLAITAGECPPSSHSNINQKKSSIDENSADDIPQVGRSKSADFSASSEPFFPLKENIKAEDQQMGKYKFSKTNSVPTMLARNLCEIANNLHDLQESRSSFSKQGSQLESVPENEVVDFENSPDDFQSVTYNDCNQNCVKKEESEETIDGQIEEDKLDNQNTVDPAVKEEENFDESEEIESVVSEEDRDDEPHKESASFEAMSSLVNYIQPIRFQSFLLSQKRDRSYEISSFSENTALRLLADNPIDYVRYNRRQTSRIYPKGSRVDSSNYVPQVFWSAGCQFVALNFQTLDVPLQLNIALFEFNGGCGYLLKPEYMRAKGKIFDPFSKSIDGVISTSLKIKIISGQFLSQHKLSTFVEVDVFGLPSDTKRKMFKTKTVDGNSTNPRYDSNEFFFKKIVLPSLAVLRIVVYDTSGNLVGQRFLKVEELKPGYRYITLRNEFNQPLQLASLFIHLQVNDYVPATHRVFADQLANPIKFLPPEERKEKERRERERELRMMLAADKEGEKIDPERSLTVKTTIRLSRPNSIVMEKPNCHNPLESPLSVANPYATLPRMPKRSSAQVPFSKPKAKDHVSEFMKDFIPQTLNDMKLKKSYQKLKKDQAKSLNKLKKKQDENFATRYRALFGVRRHPSLLKNFRVKIRRRSSPVDSEKVNETSMNNEELKMEELLTLMRGHCMEEKDFRLHGVKDFINNFRCIAKDHQRVELKTLTSISDKEHSQIQKWKNIEKDKKIKEISPHLSRQEISQEKKHINDVYFEECFRDRMMLFNKQEERKTLIIKQQKEILEELAAEESSMRDLITKECEEQLSEVHKECESLCHKLSIKHCNVSPSSSSKTNAKENHKTL